MGRRIMIMLAVLAVTLGASPAASIAAPASGHGVGDTIRLSGGSGVEVAATLTRIVDPARGADEFNQPSSGNRFVATQFRIANVGSVAFDDAPSASFSVIDRGGQVYSASLDTVAAGPSLPAGLHVAPGQSRLGYVVFEVPAATKLSQVEYAPDFGLGDTADWDLAAASAPKPAPLAPASPADVVRAYYDAINNGDYATAWSLGGDNLGESYDEFVAGFAGTAHDDLTIEGISGTVVHIDLDAVQNDGSHKLFAGTYTVRDGVIVDANIHER